MAYIDEVEEPSKDRSKKTNEKVYYSALAKAALPAKSIDSSETVQSLDQVLSIDHSWHFDNLKFIVIDINSGFNYIAPLFLNPKH